jgi:hypothetical protein
MRFGWQFDRGQAAVGETVPVKCRFVAQDETGAASTVLEVVIPEDAAQNMLADLAKCANPPSDLVVATAIPPTDLRSP